MCGKKRYHSFHHARHDAREMRQKHDEATTEVYRCRMCQAWHVGNHGRYNNSKPRTTLPPRYRDSD